MSVRLISGAEPHFLAGGGEMGALLRAHDWAAAPLGPPDRWPQALRTAIRLLLNTRHPMYVFWGPHLLCFYNDAYRISIGPEQHPSSIAQPAREVWSEIWDIIGPQIEQVMSGGGATWQENELVPITRHGRREEVYWTYGYSPIDDEEADTGVGGVLLVCTETTAAVLATQKRAEELERQARLFEGAPGFICTLRGPDHVLEFVNAAHRRLFGSEEWVGKPVREAIPDLEGQGFFEMLDEVFTTGKRIALEGAEIRYRLKPEGPAEVRFLDFVYEPVVEPTGEVSGIFCEGYDVTERYRLHAAVVESEVRFRTMADGAPVMIWVTDPAGQCTYLNKRWYEYTGQESGTEADLGWLDAVHPEDRPTAEGAFVSANAEQRDYRVDFRLRRSDGTYRWVIDTAAARFSEHGSFLGYVGSVIDIDERRQAEVALQATTVRAEALAAEQAAILGQLAEGVIVTDSAGRITFVNEAATRIHGVARLDVPPEAYAETYRLLMLDGQPYPPMQLPLARAVLHQETVLDVRWRIRRPDGSEVLAIGSARPVLDPNGGQLGAVLTLRDDTEREAAERSVRENEARLRFLDMLGRETARSTDADAILATTTRMVAEHLVLSNCAYADMDPDQDGFTIRGNWAAEGSPSIVGHYSLADFGRLAVRNLRAGEPLVINNNLVELEPEEAATFQAIGITATICMPLIKEGRLSALMAIHDRVSHVWSTYELSLVREVTERCWAHIERVRADAAVGEAVAALAKLNATLEEQVTARTGELMAAEEALRQAQKMEAVGQLTGGLAHDFNNLLAGISGSLEMLQMRVAQGRHGEIDQFIAAAQGASKRAAALTHRLLAFSRRQTLDPKLTDVNRLIGGMEDLIRRTVGPTIEVEVVGAAGLWTTLVDPNQLENALLNLCINARDAMPEGGRLTIETSNRWLDERSGRERDLPPGQYLSLCVTDTGSGMTPEVASRAFEPFFTTKPLGVGTGLGLSMVYGFARQSNGQVRIYSEIGQGTTMCVYLPRQFGEEGEIDAREQPATSPAEQGKTVLVIDDEPTVRMLVGEVLKELGHTAIEVGDGPAGLTVLRSAKSIDLLITDVGLPGGLNGRQVADAARALRPDLKVMFITGYAENAVIGNGYLEPGMQVLTKPFTIHELTKRIGQLVERGPRS